MKKFNNLKTRTAVINSYYMFKFVKFKFELEERSASMVESATCDIEWMLFRVACEALCCVLKQYTLSSAYYWFDSSIQEKSYMTE